MYFSQVSNMTFRTSTAARSLWIPLLMGSLLFLALGGLNILNPANTGWLMQGLLDPQTNLFGWSYFRHTAVLQFPLGANPDYGMELGSSIVFSDSLPLFALPFKLLDPILPATFQYFGLWVLACILLQGVFGYLLLSRFISERNVLIAGTALLLLLPPYLMRFSIHLALGGQWLLLGGFFLYFDPRYRTRLWLVLIALATFIHAYLLVMLSAIWAADLLQRLLSRELKLRQCLANGLLGSMLVLTIMWLLGYFMLGPAPAATGLYGRMNLLSMIDSRTVWSRIVPAQKISAWEGDGFAYLGLGAMVILLLALVSLLRRNQPGLAPHSRWLPLVGMAAVLTAISVTNTISFGALTLAHFDIPQWATQLYRVFRSPGRMFWPVYYLLAVLSIALVGTRLPSRLGLGFLILGVALQAIDTSKALLSIREVFHRNTVWQSPLTSPLWSTLGERYQKIRYAMPGNIPPNFVPLTDFALRHHMTINSGNFARLSERALNSAAKDLNSKIQEGNYDSDSIYIFTDPEQWDLALQNLHDDDQAGELNGIQMILPGNAACRQCQSPDFALRRWGTWDAQTLPTLAGSVQAGRLVSSTGNAGYLSYGPYTSVPKGRLHYRITYSASGAETQEAGTWDILDNAPPQPKVLRQGSLQGTANAPRTVEGELDLLAPAKGLEVRTFTNGTQTVQLIRLELRKERSP
ncbi:MAG: hypothetical protein GAK43_01611 [Stenotrophomonas maltophilia]|nr:MAG: hypothetical protein GAK43_01611 [Stenotrophomonas maltophilia]